MVVKAYKQLYGGDPMTWGKWDNWSKSKRSPHQPRRDQKEMNKKEKDAVSKFPAYDSNAGGGSGSASSGSSVPAALASPEVISLLKKLAGKDETIAAEVEGFLPNPLKEDIREKQRTINMIRKLQQKVERKEQAIQRKEAQMAQFLEDIKQHISQEKIRHKGEMEQLRLELDEAKEALEKAKNGATVENAEMEEDLDKISWLGRRGGHGEPGVKTTVGCNGAREASTADSDVQHAIADESLHGAICRPDSSWWNDRTKESCGREDQQSTTGYGWYGTGDSQHFVACPDQCYSAATFQSTERWITEIITIWRRIKAASCRGPGGHEHYGVEMPTWPYSENSFQSSGSLIWGPMHEHSFVGKDIFGPAYLGRHFDHGEIERKRCRNIVENSIHCSGSPHRISLSSFVSLRTQSVEGFTLLVGSLMLPFDNFVGSDVYDIYNRHQETDFVEKNSYLCSGSSRLRSRSSIRFLQREN